MPMVGPYHEFSYVYVFVSPRPDGMDFQSLQDGRCNVVPLCNTRREGDRKEVLTAIIIPVSWVSDQVSYP